MSKCLILGGSGHLGGALRRHARHYDSILFSHSTKAEPGSISFRLDGHEPLPPVDLMIGAFPMARHLEGASPADVVSAVDRYLKRIGAARILQLSTDAVYAGLEGCRREDDLPDAKSRYGVAQALLDAALLARRPDTLIIRTSFIFGRAGGRLDKRLAPFAAGEKQPQDQRWASNLFKSPTEVNFLAEGIWRAAERGLSGIVNIVGPRTSIFDFFKFSLAPLGRFAMPLAYVETSADVARDTSLNSDLMRTQLQLKSEETWQWYQRYLDNPPAS